MGLALQGAFGKPEQNSIGSDAATCLGSSDAYSLSWAR